MSPARRLDLLGAECLAEIERIVAAVPPPSPEVVEEIRQIFAPAVQRIALRRAATQRSAA